MCKFVNLYVGTESLMEVLRIAMMGIDEMGMDALHRVRRRQDFCVQTICVPQYVVILSFEAMKYAIVSMAVRTVLPPLGLNA